MLLGANGLFLAEFSHFIDEFLKIADESSRIKKRPKYLSAYFPNSPKSIKSQSIPYHFESLPIRVDIEFNYRMKPTLQPSFRIQQCKQKISIVFKLTVNHFRSTI